MTKTATDFQSLTRKQLADELCGGHPIDPTALDNTEYRGISLGMPGFVDKLAWKTFKKVFYRDPNHGRLRGWNVRIEQTGLEPPFAPMKDKRGEPRCFGFYEVVPATERKLPKPCHQGLLIDYALGGNPLWASFRFMCDPLVAVNEGSVDLLLGWSYVELGFARFGTPSFFTLERDEPVGHIAHAPKNPRLDLG